jgi:hypothetical protein
MLLASLLHQRKLLFYYHRVRAYHGPNTAHRGLPSQDENSNSDDGVDLLRLSVNDDGRRTKYPPSYDGSVRIGSQVSK